MASDGPREVAIDLYLLAVNGLPVSSNVYLVRTPAAWVLVDTGYRDSAEQIRRAAASLFGPVSPTAILLTHIHPDHSGSAGELARTWGVPVYVHPDELPMAAGEYLPEFSMPLDRWVIVPVLRVLPSQVRARAVHGITDVARPLGSDGAVPGLADWEWIHVPGHTPGHVAYLRRGDGVLISGDAVLTVDLNAPSGLLLGRPALAGPPRYTTWDRGAAQRSIDVLAGTAPRLLAPGHGRPMADPQQEFEALLARPPRTFDRILVPVGDPSASRYRPPPRLYARLQWLGHLLTRLGMSPGYVVTLEVPGRRTGVIRRTNLVQAEHGGERYLVSLTGESEWVRNVRAAGGQVVLCRGPRRQAATLVEVPLADRPAIIRSYVLRAGRRERSTTVVREARAFFGVGGDLDADEIGGVADRFPVFRVVPDAFAPDGGRISVAGPSGDRPGGRSNSPR
jgi:glyoxylase-like metal-dependent hydrolase (beta-lactamase superfamily II)